ncbi:hypothetical protein BT69DRAFT_1344249 [Atractiella rhizophila]|nr:hypothetical protein BT69DRAFT_1344249 [Atractiella rhizophila]
MSEEDETGFPNFRLPLQASNRLLAYLLGGFTSCILFGVILAIASRYLGLTKGFCKMKALVILVVTCEILLNVTNIVRLCLLLAVHWGDFRYLLDPSDLHAMNTITGVMAVLLQVQCHFFLWYRAWQISKVVKWRQTWINFVLWLTLSCVFINISFGFAEAFLAITTLGAFHSSENYQRCLTIWISLSFVIDFSLAAFLVAELRHTKKYLLSSSVGTRKLINNIILFTVCSGTLILTTQAVVVILVIWDGFRGSIDSTWTLFALTILPSVYCYSFLIILLSSQQVEQESATADISARPTGRGPTHATDRGESSVLGSGSVSWRSPCERLHISEFEHVSQGRESPSCNFGLGKGISKYIKTDKVGEASRSSREKRHEAAMSLGSIGRDIGALSPHNTVVSVELHRSVESNSTFKGDKDPL